MQQHSTQFVKECITHLVTSSECPSYDFLLKVISELQCRDLLHVSDIQSLVNGFPKLLPVELIVEFDKLGIISFINYFQSCVDDPKKLAHWVRILVSIGSEPDEEDQGLLIYLLLAIIGIGYGDLPPEVEKCVNGKTIKAAVVMMNSITRKIWDFLWETPRRRIHFYDITTCQPSQLKYLNLISFKKCCTEQLVFLLSYKPEIKATVAISSQHEWTYFKTQSNIVHLITQVTTIHIL